MSQGLAPIKKFNYFYKPFIHKISTSNSELLFGFRGGKKKKAGSEIWVTLRSHYSVDFDKIYVFRGKYYVIRNKYVSIIVKIKCVNSNNITDICNKHNFTINYTYFTIIDTHFIKIHTNIIIFDTFGGTVPPRDLSISA